MTASSLHHGYAMSWGNYLFFQSLTANQQICLVLSCIVQSIDTSLGFGRPPSDIDPSLLDTSRLVSIVAGFFLILASAGSKTSFALTMLRLSTGWVRWFIYFVMVSTNLTTAVSASLHWIQCSPVDRLWRQHLEGTCLPLSTVNGFNMFWTGM